MGGLWHISDKQIPQLEADNASSCFFSKKGRHTFYWSVPAEAEAIPARRSHKAVKLFQQPLSMPCRTTTNLVNTHTEAVMGKSRRRDRTKDRTNPIAKPVKPPTDPELAAIREKQI